MEYWVAMNETELKISLLLLEKMELTGVINIEPDFKPEEKSLSEMLEKNFFEQTNDGVSWNPFVKMVLWIAANAQSELSIQDGTHMLCRLYFYDETMILMTRDMEEDLFIFYYVPLLPKAIGGIAKYLEESGVPMLLNSSGKHQRISLPPNPADDSLPLKDLLIHSVPTLISNNLLPITIDGWCFGEHTLENILFEAQDEFRLASKDGETLYLYSVNFFDFIQSISHWIIRTHGSSIAKGREKTDA